MTQGNSNLLLRETAIPYLGQVMGYNRSEQSDQDVTKAQSNSLGDLKYLANQNDSFGTFPPAKDNMVRILRPRYGKLVEAYLTLVIITANAETAPRFRITAGTAFSSGITPATPTGAQIAQIHAALTGSTTAFNNTAGLPIVVEKLNISKFIPQVGDANYSEDCFVVGVHFEQTPLNSTGYKLVQFLVDMSAVVTRD